MAGPRSNGPHLVLNAWKAEAELARRTLADFTRSFWDEVVMEPLVWNWHMDVLCAELEAVYRRCFMRYRLPNGVITTEYDRIPPDWIERDLVEKVGRLPSPYDLQINIPPGTSKSTIVSQMAPAWAWVEDPTLRQITGSYNQDTAKAHAAKSLDIINSAKYRAFYPHVRIKPGSSGKLNYHTTRNGERKVATTGGGITGAHAHIISVDDPLNTQQANSHAELETSVKWVNETLPSRKVEKANTPTVLMHQRLDAKDPSGDWENKRKRSGLKIRQVVLPAEISNKVRPAALKKFYGPSGLLDPNRMSHSALQEQKIKMGSAQYGAQFGQDPVPAGGLIWKQWFIPVPDENMPRRELLDQLGTDWDLAFTKQDQNSASAFITAGRIEEKIFIDAIGWDWLEFPALIRWMKTQQATHFIEAKASGKSAKQTLIEQGINAVEVEVKGGDKIARANNATPVAEAGRVFVRASILERLYNDERQGILRFPKGEHADLADVLAQTLQRLGGVFGYSVATAQSSASGDDERDPNEEE